MRRKRMIVGGLAVLTALVLGACGVGQRQSPAASEEEVGTTHVAQKDDDKPASYTTIAGDTLAGVAARPEIYGDPDLWPLLQDANSVLAGDKAPDAALSGDLVLSVPRGLDAGVVDAARAKARALAVQAKSLTQAAADVQASAAPAPKHRHARKAAARPTPTPLPTASPTPVPTAVPTEAEAYPTPVPQASAPAGHHSKLLPLFFLLLLVLASLGAVLYVFARRDKQDGR